MYKTIYYGNYVNYITRKCDKMDFLKLRKSNLILNNNFLFKIR